jgi:hypothetical protein
MGCVGEGLPYTVPHPESQHMLSVGGYTFPTQIFELLILEVQCPMTMSTTIAASTLSGSILLRLFGPHPDVGTFYAHLSDSRYLAVRPGVSV